MRFTLASLTISAGLASVAFVPSACGGQLQGEIADTGSPAPVEAGPWDLGRTEVPDAPLLWGLDLQPVQATVLLDVGAGGPKPAVQSYRAFAYKEDGTRDEVTASASYYLEDTSIGAFAGATFTAVARLPGSASPRVATTRVRAEYAGKTALALLTVVELDRANDVLFTSPYMAAPVPSRAVLRPGPTLAASDVGTKLTSETNPDGVDALTFVKAVRAMSEGDSTAGCTPLDAKDTNGDGIADTFVAVPAGASPCFEVVPALNKTRRGSPEVILAYGAFVDYVSAPSATPPTRPHLIFLVPYVEGPPP
jgi:hypothetical protein